mgnify:CR=1 FL=1
MENKEQIINLAYNYINKYDRKIKNINAKLFDCGNHLGYLYLKEEFNTIFNNALSSYFKKDFKSINIDAFIHSTFKNGAAELKKKADGRHSFMKPCCPICRELDSEIVYLRSSDKIFDCPSCVAKIEKLNEQLSTCSDQVEQFNLQNKIFLHKSFSKHSKDGVRCPECNQWTPN